MNDRHSNQRTRGLTLVEVLLAIAAVMVLAAILLPALAKSKARSSHIGCMLKLKQLGLAFRMFSGDHEGKFPWAISGTNGGTLEFSKTPEGFRHYQAMSNELSSPKVLRCPMDPQRAYASSWDQLTNNTHLSYFAVLDANENQPQAILRPALLPFLRVRGSSAQHFRRSGSLSSRLAQNRADRTRRVGS